jgi:hypothetical protein
MDQISLTVFTLHYFVPVEIQGRITSGTKLGGADNNQELHKYSFFYLTLFYLAPGLNSRG